MARPLIAGYVMLVVMAISALASFGFLEGWPFLISRLGDNWRTAFEAALLLSYVTLWFWMVADHLFNGEASHSVLIGFLLVLGGGIAALAYFFLVFRPRHMYPTAGAASNAADSGA